MNMDIMDVLENMKTDAAALRQLAAHPGIDKGKAAMIECIANSIEWHISQAVEIVQK